MMVRAGGVEAAAVYLNRARDYYNTAVMGNWHPFDDIDPDQPQTYVPFLFDSLGGASIEEHPDPASRHQGIVDIWFTHYRISRDSGFGLRGDTSMINMARYVAVAPRNVSTSLRYLDFRA